MFKKVKFILLAILAATLIITAVSLILPTGSTPQKVSVASKTTQKKAKRAADFWQKPSEKKAYPDIHQYPDLSIDVSLKKQRVYLKQHKKVLYTMLASTGKKSGTPKGHFKIEPERGQHFFNPKSKEGANYWVSFKDHGVYLFHTVPTNEAGKYNVAEAKQLGASANSHGCIRLSVADAKWFFEHIQEGTPVYIH